MPNPPVLSFVGGIETALSSAVSSARAGATALAELQEQARETGASIEELMAKNEKNAAAIEDFARRAEGAVGATSTRLKDLRRQVDEESRAMVDSTVARFEAFIEFLERQSDPSSIGIAAALRGALEGLTSVEEVAQRVGDSLVPFEGRMVRLRDLLREIGPSAGEVQRRIEEQRQALEAEEDRTSAAVERLSQLQTTYAQQLTQLVEAYRNGAASLEQIIAFAQDLRRQLPSSEAAALADQVADAARQGLL